ncbi:MAG: DNA polymerase III subunit delta, partial [Lactobacillaceae bacterium]
LVGVHPYRIKLARQKNQQFSLNQLIKVNRILLEMDQKIKTSSINYDQLFVDLILELKKDS